MKNYKRDIIIFLIMFIFSIIMCNGFVRMHYTTDTYKIADIGYKTYAYNWSLKDGRILTFLFFSLCDILNFSLKVTNAISEIIAIAVSCLTVLEIKSIIESIKPTKNIKQEILVTIISYLLIFNYMYIEVLYFLEVIIISFSLFCFVLSAKFLLNEDKKGNLIKSGLLCILGIISYQGSIGFYMAFTICMIIIKYNKINIEVIKKIIEVLLISGIAVLSDLIIITVICSSLNLSQGRLSINSIPKNLRYIFANSDLIIFSSCGLLPRYLAFLELAIIELTIILYFIKVKKYKNIIFSILIIIFTVIFDFAIFVGTFYSIDCGRMHLALGSINMLLIIYVYCNTDIFVDFKNIFSIILLIYISTLFVLNTINYVLELNMVQYKNRLEKEYCERIANYIRENNINVKGAMIIPIKGEKKRIYFDDIPYRNKLSINEVKGYVGALSSFRSFTGLDLKEIERNSEIVEKYKEKLSNNSEEDDFIEGTDSVIIDDVLVIPVFIW